MDMLCELLDFMWKETDTTSNSSRVDMRITLTVEQLVEVRLSYLVCHIHFYQYQISPVSILFVLQILKSLDGSLDKKYKSSCLNEKLQKLFRRVPTSNKDEGSYKVALRLTKGPTNSCINFHTDGAYATSTSQIPLNSTSEYKGGQLCFFVNDHIQMVPRKAGSLVQHPPNVLHGVTSVTEGERKSLFIVDVNNGLGYGGVVTLTLDHIDSFLTEVSSGSDIDSSSSSEDGDSSEGDSSPEEEEGSPPQKKQKTDTDQNQNEEGESSFAITSPTV